MSTLVSAPTAMVASSQRLASEVGVELLRAGGSAVDAAIGVNAMLNLIEPFMCGLGGDLFAMVWDPRDASLQGLNASGRAPQGQDLGALESTLGDGGVIPGVGAAAVTVPGAVAGWQRLHERYGRLDPAAIFAPVVAHAERGVTIGPATAEWWFHCAQIAQPVASDAHLGTGFRQTFLHGDKTPAAGAVFRNPALGASYRRLGGAGFEDFYRGGLAADLARYLADCGCAVSADDLAACTAQWVDPITTSYRGCDIYELPPNGQGLAALQMLNLLEQFPLGAHDPSSADYWHWFIEAKKLAFEDRARYYADPDFAEVPVAALASKAYARERATLIGEHAAVAPLPGDPGLSRGDTTYLSVADNDGMMVSLIQSIFSGFGSALVPPSLGFALQSRGAGFSLEPGHPNVYAPGKRPFHTIMPAFACRDGEPWMSFGVMGADMQPQGQVEVLVNMLDFALDPQAAGAALRLRHDGRNHPHLAQPADSGIVWFENGFDPAVLSALAARGHDVREASHPVLHFMGGYQCIRREASGWSGASEPRFDGCASGY